MAAAAAAVGTKKSDSNETGKSEMLHKRRCFVVEACRRQKVGLVDSTSL